MDFDNRVNKKGNFIVIVLNRFCQFFLVEVGQAHGLDATHQKKLLYMEVQK